MTQKDMDDVVHFFASRNIELALNHCIAAYPHEDSECELNQIDYLRHRYPEITIGYSCHEYHDWTASMFIAYGKGVRTLSISLNCSLIAARILLNRTTLEKALIICKPLSRLP